jgi:putative colanic acid biosynthesis acetyltransferase WcaF
MKRNIAYGKNYTPIEYGKRFIWFLINPLFRYSPRLLYGWRNTLLRLLGANIGQRVRLYPSVNITFPWNLEIGNDVEIGWEVKLYNLGKISIGNDVIISQYTHICAGSHNYKSPDFTLLKKPISIGSGVWIASDVFVGPGVSINNDSVVLARSVVVKDVPGEVIVGGHPAKVIRHRF